VLEEKNVTEVIFRHGESLGNMVIDGHELTPNRTYRLTDSRRLVNSYDVSSTFNPYEVGRFGVAPLLPLLRYWSGVVRARSRGSNSNARRSYAQHLPSPR